VAVGADLGPAVAEIGEQRDQQARAAERGDDVGLPAVARAEALERSGELRRHPAPRAA
jgi:hypothetical protein